MDILVEFKPNPKVEKGLKEIPDSVLYAIARQTLDMSVSSIPKSVGKARQTLDMSVSSIPKSVGKATSGQLRRSSLDGAVRGSHQNYYIGSYTDYAIYVWKMNDSTTKWTTPGTHSQWYARTLEKNGQTIINNALTQSWKDKM